MQSYISGTLRFPKLILRVIVYNLNIGVKNFETHDVLEDIDFKEGMKEFS